MSIDYRKFSCSEEEIMNLLLLIMNMHMHRMTSHYIFLNCLVIMNELLDADNSKFIAYGSIHIAIEL
jgi:hypothetical protein